MDSKDDELIDAKTEEAEGVRKSRPATAYPCTQLALRQNKIKSDPFPWERYDKTSVENSLSYNSVLAKISEQNYLVSAPEYLRWLVYLKEFGDPLYDENSSIIDLMIAYLKK